MRIPLFGATAAPVLARRASKKKGSQPVFGEGLGGGAPVFNGALSLNLMSGLQDPRETFARASANAWYQGADGLMHEALTDVPRTDYDFRTPGVPVLRGRLIEPSSDNQVLWCRDLTNAAWTKANMTVAKTRTGIDGVANSCSRLTATAANARASQAIVDASNVARTLSVYARRITGSGGVNLSLDAFATVGAVTVTSTVLWTRVGRTQTLINPTVGIELLVSGDEIEVDFVQEEERAAATSPILTTTAIATRAAELPVFTGANFSDWYVSGPGTMLTEFMIPSANVSAARATAAINNGSSAEQFAHFLDGGSGTPRLQAAVASALQFNMVGSNPAIDTVHRYATSWDATLNAGAGGADGSINGVVPAGSPDASVLQPTVNQLKLGAAAGGSSLLNGWLRSLKYWNRKLTPSELAAVTEP